MKDIRIFTRCPACHNDTLSIHEGHLFCTWITCPNPTLIDTIGERAESQRVDTSAHGATISNAEFAEHGIGNAAPGQPDPAGSAACTCAPGLSYSRPSCPVHGIKPASTEIPATPSAGSAMTDTQRLDWLATNRERVYPFADKWTATSGGEKRCNDAPTLREAIDAALRTNTPSAEPSRELNWWRMRYPAISPPALTEPAQSEPSTSVETPEGFQELAGILAKKAVAKGHELCELRNEVSDLEQKLRASEVERERLKNIIHEIDCDTEGGVDGAPDCSDLSSLCNRIQNLIH